MAPLPHEGGAEVCEMGDLGLDSLAEQQVEVLLLDLLLLQLLHKVGQVGLGLGQNHAQFDEAHPVIIIKRHKDCQESEYL